MARTPLDLRGLTMSELMAMDRDNDQLLALPLDAQTYTGLLADRRQIRAEMERRRVNFDTTHNPQNYD